MEGADAHNVSHMAHQSHISTGSLSTNRHQIVNYVHFNLYGNISKHSVDIIARSWNIFLPSDSSGVVKQGHVVQVLLAEYSIVKAISHILKVSPISSGDSPQSHQKSLH